MKRATDSTDRQCTWRFVGVDVGEWVGFVLVINLVPYELLLSTGTMKGTNMFNDPANLRKFNWRKRNKSNSTNPYFICRKRFRNGIKPRQDRYLGMRRLSNLSPFCNLSHGVFFSVDLFFSRRRPMNITGAVAGNPTFHQIKLCLTHLFK